MISDHKLLLVAMVIIFVAYLVRGITGFGSGLIAIPLLTLVYPLKVVVPIVVLLDLIGSTAQGLSNRKHINWRVLVPLLPFTVAGIALAVFVFQWMNAKLLNQALGVFVLLFAIYQLLPTPDLRGGPAMAAPFGLLGGLMGTLFGTGGPFYVIYLDMRNIAKESFRASYAIYFLIDGAIRMLVYLMGLQLVSLQFVLLFIVCLLPFAAGLYAGGRVQRDFSPVFFKKCISLVLLFSGSALVLQG